jgi:hypothetical protein
MRVFGTIVLGSLFAIAFAAFFLFQSVTRYPLDTDAIVETLRAADVRTAALDTLEDAVRRQVLEDPEDPVFAEFAVSQSRTVIDQVITDEWFYDTVGQAHRGLVDFLEQGADRTQIDLTAIKDRLREMLWEAGRHGVEMCDAVNAGRACRDAARDVQRTLRRYRGQVEQAMARVPDKVNLTWLLTMGGAAPGELERSAGLVEVRQALETMRMLRWLGLGALILLLGLVALINMRSLQRILVNCGVVLACASALYLAAAPVGARLISGEVRERLAAERAAATSRGEAVYPHIAAERVVTEILRRVTGGSDTPVYGCLGLGLALVAGGIVLHIVRRRRRSPTPRTVPPPPPYPGPMPPGYYPPATH